MVDLRFCYRLEPAANAAQDEDGNPAAAYIQLKAEDAKKTPTPEEYEKCHQDTRASLAKMFKTDIANVTPITPEEYDAATPEEEEEEGG